MMNERDPQEMFDTIWGEVATHDCYGLKTITWKPIGIVDIGANVGTFSVWANSLFPDVPILALEPDDWNITQCRKFASHLPGVNIVQAGLGNGESLWKGNSKERGGNQCFSTPGSSHTRKHLDTSPVFSKTHIPSYTLPEILEFAGGSSSCMVKCDCEGAEASIFNDPKSFACLSQVGYLAMELHYYASTHDIVVQLRSTIPKSLSLLEDTHYCRWNHNVFMAERKDLRDGD